jgi:hypothetical protein
MLMRKRSCRWLVGIGVAGMLGLTAVLMPARPACGQKPLQEESKSATEVKPPKSAKADSELEQQINQAKDELELLELQLEAKKAALRIGEARLEESKRWKAHYEGLLRSGKVTEDRFLAAKDDVLMMEAHVAGERAELKASERRVKQAKRRIAYGEFTTSPQERRVAEIEQRMAGAELRIDLLEHELGRLRRESPKETRYGPR